MPLALLLLLADPRLLPADATFADLVKAAPAMAAQAPAASRCVFRRTSGVLRLEAALDAGARSAPPADLDAQLAGPLDLALLTRFGPVGSERAGLVLQPLGPTTRALGEGLVPVFFLTDQGLSFSVIARAGTFSGGGARAQRLGAAEKQRVVREVLPRAHGVVVTAEAGVRVRDLVSALELLSGYSGEVVLATPAPPDAERPPPPEARRGRDDDQAPDLCRYGISDIPKGETHGELPMTAANVAVDRMQKAAQEACAGSLGPDGGGVLEVSMRLGKGGEVREACVRKDPAKNAEVRACVLRVVKKTRFPKLKRGTFVNFGTEVRLAPKALVQRAFCD